MNRTPLTLGTTLATFALGGLAQAQVVDVTSDITVSTTWTKDNVYNLETQIYVRDGATLTIEAGTVIASEVDEDNGGLAVTQDSMIFINGTATEPVIMTSANDRSTWTAGDPTTGIWREAALEWGNLTLMGDAYISENANPANLPFCDAGNTAQMEGLENGPSTDTYGGGDDNHDGGSISYLSLRYGGKVKGLADELNGLSLGGVGRGTDISHVEIMNNVDDGIEIWGGTVNLDHFSIWNIGDDSLDIDQGWRGNAQFGLIVQGFSLNASQGSGVGDNCIEVDGAEDSNFQPVTSTAIYNVTLVGNPDDGDHALAFRDSARVQYRQLNILDIGDDLVRFDNQDGDGGSGYGFDCTLPWLDDGGANDPNNNGLDDPDVWDTSAATLSTCNACPAPGTVYTAQQAGMLCEVEDSVFFNYADDGAATDVGVLPAGAGNSNIETIVPPMQGLSRAPMVTVGNNKDVAPVQFIDPRAAGSALTAPALPAPTGSFLTATGYRGGFDGTTNWLLGWTAADAFGFFTPGNTLVKATESPRTAPGNFNAFLPGQTAAPVIGQTWDPVINAGLLPGSLIDVCFITFGGAGTSFSLPIFGETLLVDVLGATGAATAYSGSPPGGVGTPFSIPIPNLAGLAGASMESQAAAVTSVSPLSVELTNAIDITIGQYGEVL